VPKGFAHLLQRAGGNECGDCALAGVTSRIPVNFANGHAVTVGRHQAQAVLRDFKLDAGDHGSDIVTTGGDCDLSHGRSEFFSRNEAGFGADLGNAGIFLHRHGQQCEVRGSAADLDS